MDLDLKSTAPERQGASYVNAALYDGREKRDVPCDLFRTLPGSADPTADLDAHPGEFAFTMRAWPERGDVVYVTTTLANAAWLPDEDVDRTLVTGSDGVREDVVEMTDEYKRRFEEALHVVGLVFYPMRYADDVGLTLQRFGIGQVRNTGRERIVYGSTLVVSLPGSDVEPAPDLCMDGLPLSHRLITFGMSPYDRVVALHSAVEASYARLALGFRATAGFELPAAHDLWRDIDTMAPIDPAAGGGGGGGPVHVDGTLQKDTLLTTVIGAVGRNPAALLPTFERLHNSHRGVDQLFDGADEWAALDDGGKMAAIRSMLTDDVIRAMIALLRKASTRQGASNELRTMFAAGGPGPDVDAFVAAVFSNNPPEARLVVVANWIAPITGGAHSVEGAVVRAVRAIAVQVGGRAAGDKAVPQGGINFPALSIAAGAVADSLTPKITALYNAIKEAVQVAAKHGRQLDNETLYRTCFSVCAAGPAVSDDDYEVAEIAALLTTHVSTALTRCGPSAMHAAILQRHVLSRRWIRGEVGTVLSTAGPGQLFDALITV